MDRKTEHIVRLRGGGVCEYCRLPEVVSHLPFPLDHIIARQHHGPSTEDGAVLEGLTAVGKGTARLLSINAPARVAMRDALMCAGLYPRDPTESSGSEKSEP